MAIIKGVIVANAKQGADLGELDALKDRYDIIQQPEGVELEFKIHPVVTEEPSEEDVGQYTEMIERLQEVLESEETDLVTLIEEAVDYIERLEAANSDDEDSDESSDSDEQSSDDEDDNDGGLIVR